MRGRTDIHIATGVRLSNEQRIGNPIALRVVANYACDPTPCLDCECLSIGLHASLLSFVSVEIARQSGLSSLVSDLHVQLVTKREAVGSTEAATPTLDVRKLQPIRNELRHYEPARHLGIPVPMLRQPAPFEDTQYIAASRLTVRPMAVEEIRVPLSEGNRFRWCSQSGGYAIYR